MMKSQENVLAAQENAQRPPTEVKASLAASNPQRTTDEAEFEERHGGQYHLRHHLSGCAQSLYVLDFEQDFTSSLRGTASDNTMPLPDTVHAVQTDIVAATFAATMSDSATPVAVEAVSSPSEAAVQDLQHDVQPLDVLRTNPAEPDAEDAVLLADTVEQQTVVDTAEISPVEAPTGLNSPLVADFNDVSLGGWELEGELSAEQVLENGQLHFSGDMLNAGEPLLSRSVAFSAGESYQFEMRVNAGEGSEAPRFDLRVNGETITMEATRQGNDFIMRAEFVSATSEPVNVAIMPVTPMPPASSLWLDDVVLQPAPTPLPHLAFDLQLEPVFDFAAIAIQVEQPDLDLNQPSLQFTQLFSPAELTLFAEPALHMHEAYHELSLNNFNDDLGTEGHSVNETEQPMMVMFDSLPLEPIQEPVHA